MKVLLASQSPRRRELLHKLFDSFDVCAPEVDEAFTGNTPEETVLEISKRKVLSVDNVNEYDVIIASDTLVYLDGKYYGKPKDRDDALKILSELQNRTHEVVTGIAVIKSGKLYRRAEKSFVTFKPLSIPEIEKYIDETAPYDKAGAYAIQDGRIVASYVGDYYNIMGLPVQALSEMLDEIGILTLEVNR